MASACSRHGQLQRLYADQGYAGQCAQRLQREHGIEVQARMLLSMLTSSA